MFALVDARTGQTHVVTNEAVESGRGSGRYVAVCGVMLLVASLTAPMDKSCRVCAEWVASR